MAEKLSFHFEGALADAHKLNFYEAARFQYAAARLIVKLAQFRKSGKFAQKITNISNIDINITSYTEGSFNINIEMPVQKKSSDDFINLPISDLVAYVSERIVEKVDETSVKAAALEKNRAIFSGRSAEINIMKKLDSLVSDAIADARFTSDLPQNIQDLIRRRAAESYREQRLVENQDAISFIDTAREQKLITMSAPLIGEMATALRRSSTTLEVTSSENGQDRTVLFLDRQMAEAIETAKVDKEITPILGDITQFNKDNGWGKLKIENGSKILGFSIPYDMLPSMKKKLIDNMNNDSVYLQTYFVRDKANQVVRLIAIGILPTPAR